LIDITTLFVYHNPLYVDPLFQLFVGLHILAPEKNFQNTLTLKYYYEYLKMESGKGYELMNKIINFGEDVAGYNIPVLNEREIRAAAGILYLNTGSCS